ncbi:TPA: DDE-type integrase/transposase/recombinase [Bacillus cereus]
MQWKYLKPANDSWRTCETYLKAKGTKIYLDRAIAPKYFYLSKRRNAEAAKRFLKKVLDSCHTAKIRMITVEDNKTYPVALPHFVKKYH